MDVTKALISEDEARREIRLETDGPSVLIHDLILEGTEEIEAELDRKIVSRGAITEFHSVWRASSELFLSQWPAITVTTVHEDSDRAYGATSLLVEGTDYIVDTTAGKLIRISGASPTTWTTGFEAIKVVWTAGYSNQDAVPPDLKRIAREFFAMQFRDITAQHQNLSNVSDGLGTVQRFGPPFLTSEMKKRLARHKRIEFPGGTTLSRVQ